MKKNKYLYLLISITLLLLLLLSDLTNNNDIDNCLDKIRLTYLTEQARIPIDAPEFELLDFKIDKNDFNKLIYKVHNKSETYFIQGYFENDSTKTNEYFDLALDNFNSNTNDFVKFYIYDYKAKQLFNKNKIELAKEYTDKAIDCVDINKDDNYQYGLIWGSIKKYDYHYIKNTLKTKIDSAKIDNENTYQLKRKLALFELLCNENNNAMRTFVEIIYQANKKGRTYDEVKALIDFSVMFIGMNSYGTANEILLTALNIIEKSDDPNLKGIEMYAYSNLARTELGIKNIDGIKKYVKLIHENKSALDEEDFNDFLIYADFYESVYLINEGKIDEAQKEIDEGIDLLKNDKHELIVGKDIVVRVAYANLEYAKKNYYEAISIYEEALDVINKTNSFDYKLLVINELIELYNLVGNDNIEELKQQRDSFNIIQKDELTKAYTSNLANEFKNKELLQSNYEIKINSIKMILMLVSILTFSLIVYIFTLNKLKKDNLIDGLTQVYNRKYFDKRYRALLKQKSDFSLIIFDIDNFKILNDTYGHDFGDKVLIIISETVKRSLGVNCNIYRYGGEEFVILVKKLSNDYTLEVAESIRETVESITWEYPITVTISLGVAHSTTVCSSILKKADENLYISKATGKNKVTSND